MHSLTSASADEFTYKIVNNEATITGVFNPEDIKTLLIPELLEGASVITIEVGAFDDCANLEEISVVNEQKRWVSKDGVLLSGDSKNLVCYPRGKKSEAYVIPASVRVLDERAFSNCRLLKRVEMENVSIIGHSSFLSSAVERVSIGKGLSEIHACAFMLSKLVGIELETCSQLDDFSFAGCFHLQSILFHEEIPKRLGLHAFSDLPPTVVIAFNSGEVCLFPSDLGPASIASNLTEESI